MNRMILIGAVLLGLLIGLTALTACGGSGSGEDGLPTVVSDPVVPAEPDLSAPEPAVSSYLEWISFAYRMANSDIATQTMTPWQAVRTDAYIELNRQNGEGIEQRLLDFSVRDMTEEVTSTVIAASERWWFRYFSLDTLRYTSEPHEVSYETTYTVVFVDDRWLVDDVDAEPLGPLE